MMLDDKGIGHVFEKELRRMLKNARPEPDTWFTYEGTRYLTVRKCDSPGAPCWLVATEEGIAEAVRRRLQPDPFDAFDIAAAKMPTPQRKVMP